MRQLPKVAHAGLVAVPSKFNELVREQHYVPKLSKGHRGSLHHRWIFTVQNNELLAIPKLPYLEHDENFMSLETIGMKEQLSQLSAFISGLVVLPPCFAGHVVDAMRLEQNYIHQHP